MDTIKTRFAPSPTGYLHVGGARTALFNYLLARKGGGTFLLRIEDTDRARHNESAVAKIVDDLRWLGIEWDEGFEAGGSNGPYRQSERLEIYQRYIQELLDSGKAYYAFETPEELDAMRTEAQEQKRTFIYPRPDPLPTRDDADKARAEGRPVVVRVLCPEVPPPGVCIEDEVFGQVVMTPEMLDDFIIAKSAAAGQEVWPTYHLANVVDDALMGVTLICRGQEFLAQTWRHVLLREALGFAAPKYAHLPLLMDMKGRKLSKRDGDVDIHSFRAHGYLPEVLVNFIALLGWSPGGDREKFTLSELVEHFDLSRIGKANAKFDREKLLAFNTAAVATAEEDRLLVGFKDFLSQNDADATGNTPADEDHFLRYLLKINKGLRTFADIPRKCGVLFGPDKAYGYDAKAVTKVLAKNDGAGYAVLVDSLDQLAGVEWTAEAMEAWMDDYCRTHELSMGKVAQPLRVAVTGTTVSPPIFDTLIILGKEKTLARINRCLGMR